MNIARLCRDFLVLLAATILVAAPLGLAFGSCGPIYEVPDYQQDIEPVRYGKPPESEWNRLGWWIRIADTPPTYIPSDYPASARRTDASGTWFVDKRDGTRLFVPKEGTKKYDRQMLTAAARTITTAFRPAGTPRPVRFTDP